MSGWRKRQIADLVEQAEKSIDGKWMRTRDQVPEAVHKSIEESIEYLKENNCVYGAQLLEEYWDVQTYRG